jgi:hypothetical protein
VDNKEHTMTTAAQTLRSISAYILFLVLAPVIWAAESKWPERAGAAIAVAAILTIAISLVGLAGYLVVDLIG